MKKMISWLIILSILITTLNFNVAIVESAEIEDWKQCYYDFIVRDKQNADDYLQDDWEQTVDYELIYLDEDSIPELWIDYGIWAAGCRLVTYHNGKLSDELLGKSSLIYSEYKNIFYLSYGKMGVYSDTVYSIENNSLNCIAKGVSYEKITDQSVVGYDYTWNDVTVTEKEYRANLNGYVDILSAKQAISEEENLYGYEEILENLSETESSISVSDEININNEWVRQHVAYAASEEFQTDITPLFTGALYDAFVEVRDSDGLKNYNTLDSVTKILNLKIGEISDTQEYELLLAQILFSYSGTKSFQDIYTESFVNNIIELCKYITGMWTANDTLIDLELDSEKIDFRIMEQLVNILKSLQTLPSGTEEFMTQFDELLNVLANVDDVSFTKDLFEVLQSSGNNFLQNVAIDEIDLAGKTAKEFLMYIAAGEAYCQTSDAYGEILLEMRHNINVPSENSLFSPIPKHHIIELGSVLGINTGYSQEKDPLNNPLNTPVVLRELAAAIENMYIMLEQCKNENAWAIAKNVLSDFNEGSQEIIKRNAIQSSIALFAALPVVREFVALQKLFNGTQFVIDTFTKIDDRAYHGTMLMRLQVISYIHYLTIYNVSGNEILNNTWGGAEKSREDYVYDSWNTVPINIKSTLEEYQFTRAMHLHEAINVYKAISSVAITYAKEYYAAYDDNRSSQLEVQLQQINDIGCHSVSQGENVLTDSSEETLLTTAMSITGLPYIAENVYTTPYHMTNGSIYRNEVEQQGILGSLYMDFDGDDISELLVISYVRSDVLDDDKNSVRLTMYAGKENNWQILDSTELLYSEYGQMSDITTMNGSGTPLSLGCLFLRKYGEQYQILYEAGYSGAPLATGVGWKMMGFVYEDQKFKLIDETADLYYEGSGDETDALFSLDIDVALANGYSGIVSIINTYRGLGFSESENIGYGYLTVDQDEHCYPLVRFERNYVEENAAKIWEELSKSGVSEDFWIEVMDYTQKFEVEKIMETPLVENRTNSDFMYVIPDSDSRYLSEIDVENLSLQQINYAKNEIYARKGRKFNSLELQNYFNSKSWYYGTIEPSAFDESIFNDYERANATFLANVEFSIDPNGYQLDQNSPIN